MPDSPCSRRHSLTALMAGASPAWARADEGLPVLVPADVLADHQARRPLRRDVAELRMLLWAVSQPVRLLPMPSTARLLTELRALHGVVGGTSFTRSDVDLGDAQLALSAPLVREGEFEAGLYTLPEHPAQREANPAAGLSRWSALCNREWRGDWSTLQRLGLKDVQHVATWPLMVRMLAAGRADLVLAPFSAAPRMALQAEGVTLLPLRGLKVGLPGSRHFVLAAQHPAFAALAPRLDEGIQRLRADGRLRQAYQDSGFFHPAVRTWQRL